MGTWIGATRPGSVVGCEKPWRPPTETEAFLRKTPLSGSAATPATFRGCCGRPSLRSIELYVAVNMFVLLILQKNPVVRLDRVNLAVGVQPLGFVGLIYRVVSCRGFGQRRCFQIALAGEARTTLS